MLNSEISNHNYYCMDLKPDEVELDDILKLHKAGFYDRFGKYYEELRSDFVRSLKFLNHIVAFEKEKIIGFLSYCRISDDEQKKNW